MLQPGTPVERYVIQATIGRGGMATVYRVKHAILGTQHALKVLHRTSERHKKDLIQEGRIQARLDPQYIGRSTMSEGLAVTAMPALVGIIHGTHAKIHARNGNAEQALQCLHEGETILMRSDFKSEVAKFMAKKATVYAHLGEKEHADSARTIAQSMHEELGGKDIEILIELQEAQAARGLLQAPNP